MPNKLLPSISSPYLIRLDRSALIVLALIIVAIQVWSNPPLPSILGDCSASDAKLNAKENKELKEEVQRLEVVLNQTKTLDSTAADQHSNKTSAQDHQSLINIIGNSKAESSNERMKQLESVSKRTTQRLNLEQENEMGSNRSQPNIPSIGETFQPKSCDAVVQRMHDWHNCWERHMRLQRDSDPDGKPNQRIPCPIYENDQIVGTERIGAPLYHYAMLESQGFGRVLDHTTQTCSVAFLYKRPCLINMSPRDPFHTFRSFVHQNTLHWEPEWFLQAFPEYAHQLEQLAQKLPNTGAGKWTAAIKESDYDSQLVFPMNKQFPVGDWNSSYEHYSGLNPKIGYKILFTPNWGNSWFTRIPVGDVFKREHNCSYEVLKTKLQNALYRPTDLARQLHQSRYNHAAMTTWSDNMTPRNKTNRDNLPKLRTRPHLSHSLSNDQGPSYGSIHIRMTMLNRERKHDPYQLKDIMRMVQLCLERAQYHSEKKHAFPQNWWFLADNSSMAVKVVDEIQSQQQRRGDPAIPSSNATFGSNDDARFPVLQMFHTYNEGSSEVNGDTQGEILPSAHSVNKKSTGLYGHASMAGSIEDWMALYESKISIVNRDTAYGITGARGNGLVPVAFCGEDKQDWQSQPFRLFMKS